MSINSDAAGARGTPGANPWERYTLFMAAGFLLFLLFPIMATVRSQADLGLRVLSLVAIAVFAAIYLWGYTTCRAWLVLAILMMLTLLTVPALGVGAMGTLPFLATYSALHLPRPWYVIVPGVAALAPAGMAAIPDARFALEFIVITLPVALGMVILRRTIDVGIRHDEMVLRSAVSTERERVARDVHDLLGHSLTAITLKADLAGRLVDTDPARARHEISEIAALSREALVEARVTVGGLRGARLLDEVRNCRNLAGDAGLSVQIQGTADEVAPRARPVIAWVLREAMTNVVRHSGATQVTVRLTPLGVTVQDNGKGSGQPQGNGSAGMRDRVAAMGGSVTWEPAQPGDPRRPGTRLHVSLPPASALAGRQGDPVLAQEGP